MQILTWVLSLLGSLGNIPAVGHILAEVVAGAAGIVVLVNALMALWQAVVQFCNAMAALPFVGAGFAKVGTFLSAEYTTINSWEQSWLLPLLQQISAIPVPVTPASNAAAKAAMKSAMASLKK